jgi:hypothetical protein
MGGKAFYESFIYRRTATPLSDAMICDRNMTFLLPHECNYDLLFNFDILIIIMVKTVIYIMQKSYNLLETDPHSKTTRLETYSFHVVNKTVVHLPISRFKIWDDDLQVATQNKAVVVFKERILKILEMMICSIVSDSKLGNLRSNWEQMMVFKEDKAALFSQYFYKSKLLTSDDSISNFITHKVTHVQSPPT